LASHLQQVEGREGNLGHDCREGLGQAPRKLRGKNKTKQKAPFLCSSLAIASLPSVSQAIDGGRTEDALGYLSGGCTITSFFKDRDDRPITDIGNGNLWRTLSVAHSSNGRDMGCFMSASGVQESTTGKKGDEVSIYIFFSFFSFSFSLVFPLHATFFFSEPRRCCQGSHWFSLGTCLLCAEPA